MCQTQSLNQRNDSALSCALKTRELESLNRPEGARWRDVIAKAMIAGILVDDDRRVSTLNRHVQNQEMHHSFFLLPSSGTNSALPCNRRPSQLNHSLTMVDLRPHDDLMMANSSCKKRRNLRWFSDPEQFPMQILASNPCMPEQLIDWFSSRLDKRLQRERHSHTFKAGQKRVRDAYASSSNLNFFLT